MSGYWFKFRIWDFDRSCDRVGMTDAERWAYTRILGHWYDTGDGYSTEVELKNYTRLAHNRFTKFFSKVSLLLSKTATNPVQYFHPSALAEIAEVAELREKRRKAGRASAARVASRASTRAATPDPTPVTTHEQQVCNDPHLDSRQEDSIAAAALRSPTEKEGGGGQVSRENSKIKPGPPDLTKPDPTPDVDQVQALVDHFITLRQDKWPELDDEMESVPRSQIETEAEGILRLPGASLSAAKGALGRIMASEVGRGRERPKSLSAYHLSLPERIGRIVASGGDFAEPGESDSVPPGEDELAAIKAAQLARFLEAYGPDEGAARFQAYRTALDDRSTHAQVEATLALKAKLGLSKEEKLW